MKFQVTKLPKRIDHHHEGAHFEWRLPMSDLQQRLYKAAVEQYRRLADSERRGVAGEEALDEQVVLQQSAAAPPAQLAQGSGAQRGIGSDGVHGGSGSDA